MNMRDGFCFRRALIHTQDNRVFYNRFAQRIEDGAAYLARQSVKNFSFLDTCIRTDPAWRENEEVAEVTISLLSACMQMCETQIHSFSIRAESPVAHPIHLPVAVTWTFLGSDERRLTT